MIADNFVFKGRFFVPTEDRAMVKSALMRFLTGSGTGSELSFTGPDDFFHSFFTMDFSVLPKYQLRPLDKLKASLNLLDKSELEQKEHYSKVRRTRNEIPYNVRLAVYPELVGSKKGLSVDVTCFSAIYFKITQLGKSPNISKDEYSFIVLENKMFIDNLSKALGGVMTSPPQAINDYVKNETIDELNTFGFVNVAEMLQKGRSKIEIGTDSDGLDDLRGAIENFLRDLVTRVGGTPFRLDKPEANIAQLKKLGYLDDLMEGIITQILFNAVYLKISNIKTHPRKEVNLFTCRLLFSITDEVFHNLIQRIVRYKEKVPAEELAQTVESKHQVGKPAELTPQSGKPTDGSK